MAIYVRYTLIPLSHLCGSSRGSIGSTNIFSAVVLRKVCVLIAVNTFIRSLRGIFAVSYHGMLYGCRRELTHN